MSNVAVLGAGAWGTALAGAFARSGASAVRLWGRDADAMARLALERQNTARLPGVVLAPSVAVTGDLRAAVDRATILVLAVPAQAIRGIARDLLPCRPPGAAVVIAAKGIERGTGLFLSDVLAEEWRQARPAILSGPSFAADVGRGLPTAVTLATPILADAEALAGTLGSAALRLYHSDDVRGVEIGGAAKNVLAIACGIAAGRDLGASAVAALTARAFAELGRFGRALGGRPETLAGLSGLGDLVLTCGSAQSRNFSYGLSLGRGRRPEEGVGAVVVEGVWTAPVLVRLAAEHGVEMPIAACVAAVLDGRLAIEEAIGQLMRRPLRSEL